MTSQRDLDKLDVTAIRRADVFKAGLLAAHLERTPDGVVFRYTPEWVAEGGAAVATTLPVTADPVLTIGGGVPAYFAGLLPEGRRLGALRRSVKTSPDDELSLVLAIGSDAVGDVQVLPEGWPPQRVEPRLAVESFERVRFSELLAELDIRIDRVGLAGVQDKVSLAMVNLPVTAAGDSFLLKLNPPEYKYLVQNEHFFLARAPRTGVRAAQGRLVHDADGVPGLVVTRFDRIIQVDGTGLLAVEDGCQVLGHHPEAKYRLTAEQVLVGLANLCHAPRPAAAEFLRQLVYAYVTGNGYAHAKNFSILADVHGRWAPSPAYDVPSSQPYGDSTMALAIAGRRAASIPGTRFVALGEALGVPSKAATRVVRETAKGVDSWIDELPDLPYDPGVVTKLGRVVRRRQSLLLNDQ